ncbi:dTDP-4-dehydrorhamnose 3,5-epimerase [Orrella sp. 11846]|uniref:dTDP-4-dehydrorhamnose 3,5-epimerase n=1 Tax=Orrella sp. 11846 TaxID=3409913 RepID=UPI003B5BADD8
MLEITTTRLPEVLLIKPRVWGDARGSFYESFNQREFESATGVRETFVQDNHSRSSKHVLRGLHVQVQQPQGKLVRVIEGEVFDVAVDVRQDSPTFGQWTGHHLSAENHLQLWIPAGFAHGFLVLSDSAQFLYKTTDYYAPEHERSILWNDPEIDIDWPLGDQTPILSLKDEAPQALLLKDFHQSKA